MEVLRSEVLPIRNSDDIVRVRQAVRAWAVELKFSLVEQTKLVTAASELARNTLVYGKEGTLSLDEVDNGMRRGLRMLFEDNGPGIPDIERALSDGFTTGDGLGLGLGGAKRLVNEFEIVSQVGEGTSVTAIKWR